MQHINRSGLPKVTHHPAQILVLTFNTDSQVEASSSAAQQVCAQCGKTPDTLKPCNKCHTTPYCNKDCAKAHFKTHKKVCAALAQEYVKNNEPKMASRAASKSNDRNTGYKKWEVSIRELPSCSCSRLEVGI